MVQHLLFSHHTPLKLKESYSQSSTNTTISKSDTVNLDSAKMVKPRNAEIRQGSTKTSEMNLHFNISASTEAR